jgi:hypothetical protein
LFVSSNNFPRFFISLLYQVWFLLAFSPHDALFVWLCRLKELYSTFLLKAFCLSRVYAKTLFIRLFKSLQSTIHFHYCYIFFWTHVHEYSTRYNVALYIDRECFAKVDSGRVYYFLWTLASAIIEHDYV